MSDLTPVAPGRPAWPEAAATASDANFYQHEAKTGGVTPLQVAFQRKWSILVFAVLVASAVGFVAKQAPNRYAASALVMVDTRQPRLSTGEALMQSQIVDGALLNTRMESLRSPRLALEVVDQLSLTTLPEYCAPPVSLSQRLRDKLMHRLAPEQVAPAAPCRTSVEHAASQLASEVSIFNDGRSNIIRITAEGSDPYLVAKIANAYADTFIAHEQEEQAGLTHQANEWLSAHLAELRAGVVAAEAAVEEQQQGGQLTNVGGGTLLAQSLTSLNAQLSGVTGELAQKRSMLNALEALARSGSVDASAPVLASTMVQQLIAREAVLATAQADLNTRLGSANAEVVANAAQLERVRQQIRAEVGKTITGLHNEVDTLEARRATLASNVRNLQSQLGEQANAEIRLQDLERDAASARNQYDVAAARLEQIRVEAATQRSDVQPLIEASPPAGPTDSRTKMIVVGTFMASLGIGAGLAFALELLSRVYKEAEHVEEQTGLRVLGLFPKPLRRRTKPQDAVVQEPTSREADALHAVLANLVGGRLHAARPAGRVLMVTSALPGEGKTSFSLALGRAAAGRGLSVVVVDGDWRRSVMRSLFPALPKPNEAAQGSDARLLDPLIDQASGMHILSAPRLSRNPHAMMAAAGLPRALEKLRTDHDLVIIDTPPVLAVPEALSIASLADDVVMLVQWRRTPRSAVRAALKTLQRAHIFVNGIVMSKVDLRRLGRSSNDNYYAKLYPAYHVSRRD